MKFLIIGLGIYGENLARDLTAMGHEVIGVDIRKNTIENLKDYISTVYVIDTTEESALSVLPLNNVDLVIVAIGENFGASIKTVALLKKAKVKHIFARAIDRLHESILESFNIDRILTPEQRAASDLTHEIELGSGIETLPIDKDYSVIKFKAPELFYRSKYDDLKKLQTFNLTLIAAARKVLRTNILGICRPSLEVLDIKADPSLTVSEGDVLTVFGRRKDFHDFFRSL